MKMLFLHWFWSAFENIIVCVCCRPAIWALTWCEKIMGVQKGSSSVTGSNQVLVNTLSARAFIGSKRCFQLMGLQVWWEKYVDAASFLIMFLCRKLKKTYSTLWWEFVSGIKYPFEFWVKTAQKHQFVVELIFYFND